MAPASSVLWTRQLLHRPQRFFPEVALDTQKSIQICSITVLRMAASHPTNHTVTLSQEHKAEKGAHRDWVCKDGTNFWSFYLLPYITSLFPEATVRYMGPVKPGQKSKLSSSLASRVPDHHLHLLNDYPSCYGPPKVKGR